MRLQMKVTGMDFVTSLVLFTSLSTISAEYCEEYSLIMSYGGRYCTGEGDSNLVMPAHHCQATCFQSATFNAYNYNVKKGICTCFTSPCLEAKSNPIMEFVVFTQRPYETSYEWVPYSSGDTADNRMIYTDDPRRMISRMQKNDNDFGCYFFTPHSNCFASTGFSSFHQKQGYPCQRLRIKEGCTIFWVPYVARDPIPPRAVITGRMANGDRVYVTKFDYNQPPVQSLAGHYVEGAGNTFVDHAGGTRSSSAMMMMVVL